MSKVKNPSLAAAGKKELTWAESHMPVLKLIGDEFEKEKPFKGLTIGLSLHVEKKTGVLLKTLVRGGAKVFAASCNPNTTDDIVAAALAEEDPKNLQVFAWAGQTTEDYYWCIDQVLDAHPNILIDDGCDLSMRIHTQRPGQLKEVIGACEETTTGLTRLRAMEKDGKLRIPTLAVNDAYSKYLLDNQFGTAQSTLDALVRGLNILLAGKTAVVCGYGWCGRGIASGLRGLGANVVVVEIEGRLNTPDSGQHRAITALYSGYRVLDHMSAAKIGQVFVTATGNKNVLRKEHFEVMRDGAIMCNSGHFNVEIDEPALRAMSTEVKEIKDNVVAYKLKDGRTLYLLSEGRLVNLSRPMGQGHPIEIMDGSFAVQALSCQYIGTHRKSMKAGVVRVPQEIDDQVASLILKTQNVVLDKPTKEQTAYASEWQEGT